jgi:hypothetical protein
VGLREGVGPADAASRTPAHRGSWEDPCLHDEGGGAARLTEGPRLGPTGGTGAGGPVGRPVHRPALPGHAVRATVRFGRLDGLPVRVAHRRPSLPARRTHPPEARPPDPDRPRGALWRDGRSPRGCRPCRGRTDQEHAIGSTSSRATRRGVDVAPSDRATSTIRLAVQRSSSMRREMDARVAGRRQQPAEVSIECTRSADCRSRRGSSGGAPGGARDSRPR